MTPAVVLFWPWTDGGAAASTLERLRAAVPDETPVTVLERRQGFAAALNQASREAGRADLAIVADACLLPGGWLQATGRAAADEAVGGATAGLTHAGEPALLADPVRPVLLAPQPHCAYIRRSALELVGPFDESLEHPVAVLEEFAARAVSRGLGWVLADDVSAVRIDGGLEPCPDAQRALVLARHPWLEPARREQDELEVGSLRRALVAARVAARGPSAPLSVTVDARALGPGAAGTQTYVGGLAVALARSGHLTVRAVVRDGTPGAAFDELRAAGIEVLVESRASDEIARTDIAHRPQQAFVPEDLSLLRRLGERVVITHLDLISYRNPTYHESPDEWRRYRRLTRVALAASDHVVFLSDHARRDAISEDLIERAYTSVSGVGVELDADSTAHRPAGVPEGRELLVVIGADYSHKNRPFALELMGELRRRGWDGALVLAGAHVAHGGSAAVEAELLRAQPELAGTVVDIGLVSEPEKRWLLASAAAVVCPSTYEGFGLAPLEAAAAGTPCLYAPVTSLREVAGAAGATLVPWDAAASAEAALPLLSAGEARERHLASLREALGRYRWDAVVAELEAVYREAISSPYRSSVPRAWEELEREQLIVRLGEAYEDLRDRTEHGRPLIDERGGMLTHEQQRGLMRIAARRWLRGPVLGSIGALGGIGYDDQGPSPP
jgi:glycosyltransferase involved in cell wall biosynthesis